MWLRWLPYLSYSWLFLWELELECFHLTVMTSIPYWMFPCDCDDFHTFLIAGCSFGNLSFYFFIEEQSSLQAALLYIGSFPFGVTMFICTLVVYICITGTFILSLKNRAVYKPLFFIQRVCYSGLQCSFAYWFCIFAYHQLLSSVHWRMFKIN